MHALVADIVVDCLQNSVEAEASKIVLVFDESDEAISITIEDNGKGMDQRQLLACKDPFYTDGTKHKKRKVGLGLPFLFQTAELTGGTADIQSTKGEGTVLKFSLPKSSIDLPPIGDISSLFLQCLIFDGTYELLIERIYSSNNQTQRYALSRSELKEVLGDFGEIASASLLKQFLESQESEIIKEN